MADSKISALPASTTPLAGTEVLPIVQSGTTKKVAVSDLTAGRTVAATSFASYRVGADQYISTSADGGVTYINVVNNANTSKMPLQVKRVTTAGTTYPYELDGNDNVLIGYGNIVPQTAAKGVNFTANTPAAGKTSQLLNWYEEGTWTVVIEGSTSAGTATYTTQTGKYVRIGSCVTVIGKVGYSSHTGTGTMKITGLPFTSSSDGLYSTFVIDAANLTIPANSIAVVETNPNTTYLTVGSITTGTVGVSALAMDTAASLYFQATYFV